MQVTRCPKEPHAQRSWHLQRSLPAQSEDLRTEVRSVHGSVVGRVSPTTSGSSNAAQCSLAPRQAARRKHENIEIKDKSPRPRYMGFYLATHAYGLVKGEKVKVEMYILWFMNTTD